MADSTLVILKAVRNALVADTTVSALVGTRIYSDPPKNATFPYIYVSIQSGDYSGHTFTGMEHTITIQAYSRINSPDEAGNIKSAVYDVLNRNESGLTLDSGRLANIGYNGVGLLALDTDLVTWVGLSQFRAVVTTGA